MVLQKYIKREVYYMSEHDHDCHCGHDHNEENEMTVTLTLDDGTELECAVLTIFPVEDNQYIALLPIEENSDEEGEVFLYRFTELENGELELENIEDDDEYEKVADIFDELLDDEELDDMLEEDEED